MIFFVLIVFKLYKPHGNSHSSINIHATDLTHIIGLAMSLAIFWDVNKVWSMHIEGARAISVRPVQRQSAVLYFICSRVIQQLIQISWQPADQGENILEYIHDLNNSKSISHLRLIEQNPIKALKIIKINSF